MNFNDILMGFDINIVLEFLYESITFDSFLKFSILYFFIVWIAVLLWVIRDIANRTDNIIYQIFSILTILFLSPLGIFIYLLIRPSKTLFEKYYNEIEENLDLFNQMIEEKDKIIEQEIHCFKCGNPVKHDFKFCPNCKTKLKKECIECNKVLFADWKNCPYCGVEQKTKKTDKKKSLDI